jgi:hypothetical protein
MAVDKADVMHMDINEQLSPQQYKHLKHRTL